MSENKNGFSFMVSQEEIANLAATNAGQSFHILDCSYVPNMLRNDYKRLPSFANTPGFARFLDLDKIGIEKGAPKDIARKFAYIMHGNGIKPDDTVILADNEYVPKAAAMTHTYLKAIGFKYVKILPGLLSQCSPNGLPQCVNKELTFDSRQSDVNGGAFNASNFSSYQDLQSAAQIIMVDINDRWEKSLSDRIISVKYNDITQENEVSYESELLPQSQLAAIFLGQGFDPKLNAVVMCAAGVLGHVIMHALNDISEGQAEHCVYTGGYAAYKAALTPAL